MPALVNGDRHLDPHTRQLIVPFAERPVHLPDLAILRSRPSREGDLHESTGARRPGNRLRIPLLRGME
jgi:hypothetical protein